MIGIPNDWKRRMGSQKDRGAYNGSGLHAISNSRLSEEEGRDSDVATVAHELGVHVIIYAGMPHTILSGESTI